MSENHRAVVVTRTRNRPLFLRRAAESLCAQTEQRFGWIVVNDGGERDPVDDIVRAFSDSLSCEVVHLTENVGMEEAGNRGLTTSLAAGADYAALHDDDDRWSPDFLSEMAQALDAEVSAVGAVCRWQEVTETLAGDKINVRSKSGELSPGQLTLPRLAVRNRFPPIALLFRIEAWKAAGGFEASLPVLGDWDFNLRLLAEGDLISIDNVLAYQHVRVDAQGAASNSIVSKRSLHVDMRARVINRHLRRDFERGRPGLGALLAQADILEDGLERTSPRARLHRLLGRDA